VAGVQNFQDLIRFDATDILSNTNEVEYGVVNRIYGKRTLPKAAAPCKLPTGTRSTTLVPLPGTAVQAERCEDAGSTTRELFSWEVKQKHFFDSTFGNSIVPGQSNVVTSTVDFTAVPFLTDPRHWSPIVSKVRASTSANSDAQWELDYDPKTGQITDSTAFLNYRLGSIFLGASHAYFRIPGELVPEQPSGVLPPPEFNQIRGLIGYGHPNKLGPSIGTSIGFDEHFHYLQYAAVQTNYNWDCCGLSFEFRQFSLNSAIVTVRNSNEFRFALTLANIGTAGNIRRQEQLF
jgi:LPS-assembly protein